MEVLVALTQFREIAGVRAFTRAKTPQSINFDQAATFTPVGIVSVCLRLCAKRIASVHVKAFTHNL